MNSIAQIEAATSHCTFPMNEKATPACARADQISDSASTDRSGAETAPAASMPAAPWRSAGRLTTKRGTAVRALEPFRIDVRSGTFLFVAQPHCEDEQDGGR